MDPHADAHMHCIYSEVCNCTGSGAEDMVQQRYLHPHLHLIPHRWFHMLDSKHYLLIPGDDISSDIVLSGCSINTDNQEERRNHTLKSLISCFRILNG